MDHPGEKKPWRIGNRLDGLSQGRKMKEFKLDSENEMLAGVCSGLAKYTGIDVTLIRALFVIATCLSGFPILLYIIIAILAPDE